MKNLIGIFMILALLVSTGFPGVPHAMMSHDVAKAEKTEAYTHGDCHKARQSGAVRGADKNNKDTGECCDKGMCKCVGGSCYGMSKILGSDNNSFSAILTGSEIFAFDNKFVEPNFPRHLKRPPSS